MLQDRDRGDTVERWGYAVKGHFRPPGPTYARIKAEITNF